MSRRRPRRLIALIAMALTAVASSATAGLADRIGVTFGQMAEAFIKASQPVEGTVVSLDGDRIYVDLGQGTGAQVGQEMVVFRKGGVFYHSVTGKPLGRYEEQLGYAHVRRVFPQFAEADFIAIPDKPPPVATDGVRISRGRVRIAITPVLDLTNARADVRRVPYMLASVLERSKRFQVVDPLAVGDMFASGSVRVEEVLSRPERAVRASKNLDVRGWLVPVLIERRGITYLDVTWISAVTGTALLSRRGALLPSSATEEQRFPWEPGVED